MKDKFSELDLLKTFEHHTTMLSPEQVRCIRKLNAKLVELLATSSEADYFESCQDVFRSCAEIIKQANILDQYKKQENGEHIANEYSNQALENSIDGLEDLIESRSIIRFDN